jgi:predicted transcriptional regulator
MDVLRSAGTPLSPGQVRQRLAVRQPEDLSYSTVVTILSRLHAKCLLERERVGRAFAYRPVDDASLAASQMSRALQAGTDHRAVLSRFVSGLSGRDARLLRRLLADGQDQPAGG